MASCVFAYRPPTATIPCPLHPTCSRGTPTSPAANAVWASDMTYIATREGWLYLAVVLDLFSRRIVGSAIGATITAQLACRVLDMAWNSRVPSPGLIFHSDPGCQNASHRYTELLGEHGIKTSMSLMGNCWDNACSKTLFGSLRSNGCMA